ncbi:MAG: hypothetical protein A2Y76_12125 [Planctomycetes bacterium RBG_13_60_9]|nr:MAG: hypothetical protein A2Y76_12125 [Planctomycetes bacterium RBG_13_60_9]
MAGLRHSKGVTLIEMLVVLGIIVVLAGIVVTVTLRVGTQSNENVVNSAFTVLGSALREYHEFMGQFPPQAEQKPVNAVAHVELLYRELYTVPASRQVLEKLDPKLVTNKDGLADVPELRDPWGTVLDYIYTPDDSFPELISAGRDKQFGTADDINSKGKR